MPPKPPTPEIDQHGRFIDSGSGLIVPSTYTRNPGASIANSATLDRPGGKGLNQGLELARDPNTLAVKFPRKGSGFDDLISQAIVDGRVANAGVSPVISPQMSAMVRRQQNQAMSATIDVTGRRTPSDKARDAISMFNDSPLGVTDALETMIYRLCTYNRGTPIATVPIPFEFETWEEHGLIAHPILGKNQKEANATRFWLEVDWERHGVPIPYLPHPFDLEATGNEQYPYWYRATRQDGKRIWVLLHCSQIVPILPGKSGSPGVGNSPAWMCLGWLCENILFTDERVEKMLYALTDGIVIIGGVHDVTAESILKEIKSARQEHWERGFSVAKGTTLIASPVDQVSTAQITLRQPPGIEFKDWREWCEDVIAFCFGEPLSALVTRGGVGYGAQADAATENAAEAGIGAHLSRIGSALGSIYPRVQITVTRNNDRVARANIRAFTQFASGAGNMIDKGVITAEQANVIIDRDILRLPDIGDVTASTGAEEDESDLDEPDSGADSDQDQEQPEQPAQRQPARKPAPPSRVAAERGFVPADYTDKLEYGGHMPHNYEMVYYRDDQVSITDEDEARALELARRRVGQDCYELLTATPVED